MKRLLCLLVALVLLVPAAAFAQPVAESQPLSGERYFPDGADASTATYVFRYACPQFEAQTEADEAINAYFASLASAMAAAAAPDAAGDGTEGEPTGYTQVAYSVTSNTGDYVSVLLTTRQFSGNAETESWTSVVFARNGVYAGRPVSLSQAMGLEQEADEATGGSSYAAQLVYGLVWQIIGGQQAAMQRDYYPGLSLEDLEAAFSPESDFYLDENGNFVFFIQSGAVAGEVEGVLTFPFSMAELLSAVQDQPQATPVGGAG